MEEFKWEDLKNGQLVWLEGRDIPYVFYKDVHTTYYKGDVLVRQESASWDPVRPYSSDAKIIKVGTQEHPYNLTGQRLNRPDYPIKIVWEYVKETPEQRQIKELQATIKRAQEQIDALVAKQKS